MTAVTLPRMPAQHTAGSVKLLQSPVMVLSDFTKTFHVINRVTFLKSHFILWKIFENRCNFYIQKVAGAQTLPWSFPRKHK